MSLRSSCVLHRASQMPLLSSLNMLCLLFVGCLDDESDPPVPGGGVNTSQLFVEWVGDSMACRSCCKVLGGMRWILVVSLTSCVIQYILTWALVFPSVTWDLPLMSSLWRVKGDNVLNEPQLPFSHSFRSYQLYLKESPKPIELQWTFSFTLDYRSL